MKIFVIDVRYAACTRCNDVTKPVVAVIYSDLSGGFLATCAGCLDPSLDSTAAHPYVDIHTNFTPADTIERHLGGKPVRKRS